MAHVSIFKNIVTTDPEREITVDDFLFKIREGEWKTQIEVLQAEEDPEKKKKLKEHLPAVTVSGNFVKRSQNELIAHSGFICMDIDKLDKEKLTLDMARIKGDPYTYALFKSCGGRGFAVIIKIDGTKHKESFEWIAKYYQEVYGISIDRSPSNVVSARFVSYDPNLYINRESKESGVFVENEKKKKENTIFLLLPQNEFEKVVHEVLSKGIDFAPTYPEYRDLAFALGSEFGESGRHWFHLLCQNCPKYSFDDAEIQYTNGCRKGGGITIGTFYWMAKKCGVTLPKMNSKYMQIALVGKKLEQKREDVVKDIMEIGGITEENTIKFVDSVYDNQDVVLDKICTGKDNIVNMVKLWLKHTHSIRENVISRQLEDNGKTMEDKDLLTIVADAIEFFNCKSLTERLVNIIIFSSYTPSYNPITEYINSNRWRTSTGNLLKLCECVESNTKNKDLYIRKWLLSIIASYHGKSVRSALVLAGDQWTGKSHFFQNILPEALQKYSVESSFDDNNKKDDSIAMCENLIILNDEMQNMSKKDVKVFKDMCSKVEFNLRVPYGRINKTYKRLALMCGTSNDMGIINDLTGNTRILPIELIKLKDGEDGYASVDKDELFMELVRLYESGEPYDLTKEEREELQIESKNFSAVSMEEEMLYNFFRKPEENEKFEFFTATQIKNVIEENTPNKPDLQKIGIILRRDFVRKIKKINGKPLYGYEVFQVEGKKLSQIVF